MDSKNQPKTLSNKKTKSTKKPYKTIYVTKTVSAPTSSAKKTKKVRVV